MKDMMKAYYVNAYDGNDLNKMIYGELPIPEIKEDEVLIKVASGSFNPCERQVGAGEFEHAFSTPLPFVFGVDCAGVIEETGAEVTNLKAGDRVIVYLGFAMGGGSGEYVATKAKYVAPAPTTMPLCEAGVIPLAALTGWEACFTHGKLEKGHTVIVNGASGGVGSHIVQFAKWKGAYVIGVDHPSQEEAVKKIGVDMFVNFKTEKAEEKYDGEVDLIINFSNAPESQIDAQMSILKPGGTVVNGNAASAQKMLKQIGGKGEKGVTMDNVDSIYSNVNYIIFSVDYDTESLTKISRLIDEGCINPFVTDRIAVKDLKSAHESYLKGLNNGKILVVVDESLK
ncbi:MAG TPA: NADP-dependent oxidoreductase [Anaerovoracaceae bacterium]|nr:NADP-dependent oxidoreductase [Anaerovoracaceae bacterium]